MDTQICGYVAINAAGNATRFIPRQQRDPHLEEKGWRPVQEVHLPEPASA